MVSYKLLVGVYQIYNLAAVRDKDELVGCLGQKVKGQGSSETK